MKTCQNRTPGKYEGNPFLACVAEALDCVPEIASRDAGDVEASGHVLIFTEAGHTLDGSPLCPVCLETARDAINEGKTCVILETDSNGFVVASMETPAEAARIADRADAALFTEEAEEGQEA